MLQIFPRGRSAMREGRSAMLQTFSLGGVSAMLQIFRGKVCNVADLPGGVSAMLQTFWGGGGLQGGRSAIQHRNYYQVRPVSIAAELNRKKKPYWFQINKNLPLFDRANSMLWRTASLFTAVIQVTTRVTCDAWRVHINNDNMETVLGEVQRLSKHEISGAFSGRIH